MKKNVIRASSIASLLLLALSAARPADAAPFELCGGDGRYDPSAGNESAATEFTITNCVFAEDASVEPPTTSTRVLSISGGSALGKLSLQLDGEEPLSLAFSGGFAASGLLQISGVPAHGSSILITGCSLKSVDLTYLSVVGAEVGLLSNAFMVSGAENGGAQQYYYFLTTPLAVNSTLVIAKNTFTLNRTDYYMSLVHVDNPFENSLFESVDNVFDASTSKNGFNDGFVVDLSSKADEVPYRRGFVKQGEVAPLQPTTTTAAGLRSNLARGAEKEERKKQRRDRKNGGNSPRPLPRSRGHRSSSFVGASDPLVDWSLVTDEEARAKYGKSTFRIINNTILNMTGNPLEVGDYSYGNDFYFERNVVTGKSFYIDFETAAESYAIQIVIRHNVFGDSFGTGYRDTDVDLETLPPNSVFDYSHNTIVTGNDYPYFVYFSLYKPIANSSRVYVRSNTMIANDGSQGLEGRESYTVTLSGPSPRPIAICNNTIFGVEINTDELVVQTIDLDDNEDSPAINVSECELWMEPPETTTESTPPTTTTKVEDTEEESSTNATEMTTESTPQTSTTEVEDSDESATNATEMTRRPTRVIVNASPSMVTLMEKGRALALAGVVLLVLASI